MTRSEALIHLAAGYAANPDLSAKGVDPIGEAESALINLQSFQRIRFDPEPEPLQFSDQGDIGGDVPDYTDHGHPGPRPGRAAS